MITKNNQSFLITPNYSPVAIGGLGGSGTRLIAGMLQYLGFYIGDQLNESIDNLWYTLLMKRPELLSDQSLRQEHINIFVAVMSGVPLTDQQHQQIAVLANQAVAEFSAEWATMMVADLLAANLKAPRAVQQWGWKEPNTHIFLPDLFKQIPTMRYIHVMRHGLDMAFSANKNQLRLWGQYFLQQPVDESPQAALRYWVVCQQRAENLAKDYPNQFYLLNYDDFCLNPEPVLTKMLAFLGLAVSDEECLYLLSMPTPPEGLGRYRAHDLSGFNTEDVNYVRSLGFKVETNSGSDAFNIQA